ncbi:MAG: protein kinase [Polyangiales bacterium]
MDEQLLRARVGRELAGSYRLLRLIGSGGMGAVYEARHAWTDRLVAVKLLHPDHVKKREMVSRFLTEARAASAIRHPNIVDVLDMGYDPGERTLFITQELLRGEDLAARLEREHKLAVREALDAVVPVMGALISAHRKGILHRDVKPENVFLARGEGGGVTPKLIDFGIARVLSADTEQRTTRAGTTVGTPQYMSPEQARGEDDLDARTDVWALGVLLYECLSGVRPFEAANYNLVVVKIVSERPAPLLAVAPEVPPSVAAVVDRALALERDDRWADAAAMLDALLACRLPHETTALATRHARSIRTPEEDARLAEGIAAIPELPDDLGAPPATPSASAWVGPYLALLAVVAALSVGLILGRRSAPEPPPGALDGDLAPTPIFAPLDAGASDDVPADVLAARDRPAAREDVVDAPAPAVRRPPRGARAVPPRAPRPSRPAPILPP